MTTIDSNQDLRARALAIYGLHADSQKRGRDEQQDRAWQAAVASLTKQAKRDLDVEISPASVTRNPDITEDILPETVVDGLRLGLDHDGRLSLIRMCDSCDIPIFHAVPSVIDLGSLLQHYDQATRCLTCAHPERALKTWLDWTQVGASTYWVRFGAGWLMQSSYAAGEGGTAMVYVPDAVSGLSADATP